ncbi:hypothetical protein [Halosegnis sp.]|uniref:hypothetical protein n=1 Tax=Halosegnis sp. TaxID=2864959 RepID=UPI0035D48082
MADGHRDSKQAAAGAVQRAIEDFGSRPQRVLRHVGRGQRRALAEVWIATGILQYVGRGRV